jgi:hypothetical protein
MEFCALRKTPFSSPQGLKPRCGVELGVLRVAQNSIFKPAGLETGTLGLTVRILFYFIVNVLKFDSRRNEHFFGVIGIVITPLGYNADNAAIDYQHSAGAARGHAAVECRAVNGYAAFCRLANGVLFRVNGADTVCRDAAVFVYHLFQLVPDLIAMRQPMGASHITRNKNVVVLRDNRAASPPVAGGAFGNSVAHFHEVFVPRGPSVVVHPVIITQLSR